MSFLVSRDQELPALCLCVTWPWGSHMCDSHADVWETSYLWRDLHQHFVLCDVQLIYASRSTQFLPFLHHAVSVAYLWPEGLQQWWLHVLLLLFRRIVSEHLWWTLLVSSTWIGIELSRHTSCCLSEFFGLRQVEPGKLLLLTLGLPWSQASCLAQPQQSPEALEELLLFLVSELFLDSLSSPFCSVQGMCFEASAMIGIVDVCRISSVGLFLWAITLCSTR